MSSCPCHTILRPENQLQKLNQQRNVNLIKEFREGVVYMFVTLMNYCAYMQDYDNTIMEKCIVKAQITPYKNKTTVNPERREENKHPWDIAQEIWQNKNRLPWLSNGPSFP